MQTLNTIAEALVLGALGRQRAATHESILQRYQEMKSLLADKFPAVSLVKLEEAPQSGGALFMLKEDLANVVAYRDESLLQISRALISAAEQYNPELLEILRIPKH